MGTFTSRFYNKDKDIILNPLDDRSPYWSIFNEAKNTIDFETIATALIPDTGSDPFFHKQQEFYSLLLLVNYLKEGV